MKFLFFSLLNFLIFFSCTKNHRCHNSRKGPPGPACGRDPPCPAGPTDPLLRPPAEVPAVPAVPTEATGRHCLAGGHTTFTVAEQRLNRVTGPWPLHNAAATSDCPERPRPPDCAPSRPRGVARAPASPSRDRTRRPSRQARWRCGPLRCPGRRPDSQPTPPRPTSALQHTRGRQHPPAAAPECRLSVTMGVQGAGGGRRASGQPTTVSPQSEHWEPRITTQGLVL